MADAPRPEVDNGADTPRSQTSPAHQKPTPKAHKSTSSTRAAGKGKQAEDKPTETPQLAKDCPMDGLDQAIQERPQLERQINEVKHLKKAAPDAYTRLYEAAWSECLARANGRPAFVGKVDLALTLWRLWHQNKTEDELVGEGQRATREVGVSLAAAD